MPFSEWTATGERNQFIEFDLESTPLQVFTNSIIGSGDMMWIQFANLNKDGIVGFVVKFDSNPFFNIGQCVENVQIPLIVAKPQKYRGRAPILG